MSLLGAPFMLARGLLNASVDLVGAAATATAAAMAEDALTAAQATIEVVGEALGATPARRISSSGQTHWIDVRGLGADNDVALVVSAALRETPGVVSAYVNGPTDRAVITVARNGPSAARLGRVIADAEQRCGVTRGGPVSLPGDDVLLTSRIAATLVSGIGLSTATLANMLPLSVLPRMLAAPVALANHHPGVRRVLETRLGVEGTDLLFAMLNATTSTLASSPSTAVSGTVMRAMLTMEAVTGRRAWQRMEPRLSEQAAKSGDIDTAGQTRWHGRSGATYAHGSVGLGIAAGAVVGVLAGAQTGAATAEVAVPKAVRTVRESFCCAISRGLQNGHGALVMRPQTLRWLADVDTVVVDPRILYTDLYTVSRVRGVASKANRTAAWAAATAALEAGELCPGWNPVSGISGDGEALVTAIRAPLAVALLTEARAAGARVVGIYDDGLHSLKTGFDELRPSRESLDEALAGTVADLRADGAVVALLSSAGSRAAVEADVAIGVLRDSAPPVWGADVLVPDLATAWRVLRTIPAARAAAAAGVSLSAGSSVLGSLMLIPSVPGNGPASVDLTATWGLLRGSLMGRKVFSEPLPHPESGHDWYALPVEEVERLLPRPPEQAPDAASAQGVLATSTPARVLMHAYGVMRDYAGAVREDLSDPMTPILATGAAASALLGSPLDALMVASVLVGNAAISAQQTVHAQRVLDHLLAVQEPPARLSAGGGFREIDSAALRPGDLIEIRSGEVVPADARLVQAEGVEVDESALTGESLPVAKNTEPTPGVTLAERTGMVYAGTTMVAGRALGIVVAAGPATQVRRALAMSPSKKREVGLSAQLGAITKKALPWSLAGGGLVGLLSLLRGTPVHEAASGMVGISVAAVPEGLPLVVTLAQSASARQLTGSSVLIRNAKAIEAFARVDAVCFDKTGTLSQNRLRVTSVRPLDGFAFDDVLRAAAETMPSDGARLEHATDKAVRDAAAEHGIATDGFDALLPFQSDRPFAAALIGTRIVLKGAPDVLANAYRCIQPELETTLEAMAAEGLRVLAVATCEVTPAQAAAARSDAAVFDTLCREGLRPLGLLGLADTPRPGSQALLEELQSRGIGIKLITGDHPVTAAVIANQLGVPASRDDVVTGSEWDAMTALQRSETAQKYSVFARMSPEHKVEVVHALESAGLVTVMVGDGANDAAAIRAASVGVGVVSTGSDPARMAADVMLLDGEIGALVYAIDEGEQLWRRVQSAVSMLLGHNVGEVSFGIITSLVTGRPALTARQMLLVNMLTDALPAAAVAVSAQAQRDGVVHHDEAAIWRAVAQRGVFTGLGGTLAWALAYPLGTPRRAATVGLIGLVLSQMMQTLSDSHGPLVIATNVGTLGVMGAVISTPGLSQLFDCTPVGPIGWGQAVGAALVAGGVSGLLPRAIDRAAEVLRPSVVDAENADTNEDGVDVLDSRSQQSHAGIHEGVGADAAKNVTHTAERNPEVSEREGLPN